MRVYTFQARRASTPHPLLPRQPDQTVQTCPAGKRARNFATCAVQSSAGLHGQAKSLKEEVKRAVANTNRGKKTTPQQQTEILRKIEGLEAKSPTQNPALSELLSGRWSLLYTGPGRDDDVDWQKRTGGVEGPVLAALRPLSVNAVKTRGITQIIDAERGVVENLAEFRVANLFDGYLNVAGTVAPVRGENATRVDVEFTAFSVRLGSLPEFRIPLGWPKKPTGWVETTYLDEDFRIGRGDKGSVFVTARRGKQGAA